MKPFKSLKSAQKWANENCWGECSVILGGDYLNQSSTVYPQHYYGELTFAAHKSLGVR